MDTYTFLPPEVRGVVRLELGACPELGGALVIRRDRGDGVFSEWAAIEVAAQALKSAQAELAEKGITTYPGVGEVRVAAIRRAELAVPVDTSPIYDYMRGEFFERTRGALCWKMAAPLSCARRFWGGLKFGLDF